MCGCFRTEKIGEITVVNEGLFYYGPNYGVLLFNVFLTILFSVLAWALASPHPAASAVGAVWALVVLYFLLRGGLADPGIIPKQLPPPTPAEILAKKKREEQEEKEKEAKNNNNNNNNNSNATSAASAAAAAAGGGGDVEGEEQQQQQQNEAEKEQPTRARESIQQPKFNFPGERNTPVVIQPHNIDITVEVRSLRNYNDKMAKTMELQWCYTCQLQRPLRASHCRWCDCCIEKHDHHCPWYGMCVGKRNYRYFFGFVTSLSFYCLYMCGCMIGSMVEGAHRAREDHGKSGNDAFSWALEEKHYLPIVCLIAGVITLALVGGLACYHCGLTAENQTTHEALRRYYHGTTTPFDQGACCKNCATVLCGDQDQTVDIATKYPPHGIPAEDLRYGKSVPKGTGELDSIKSEVEKQSSEQDMTALRKDLGKAVNFSH